MNDLGWTVFAGAALREQLLYPADWFNSYSCSLDDNVYILIGLIISQDVIQEYLSRNHKGNCYRQMHSRSKHCHVTTSDQSEISVMLASGPSVRSPSTWDAFNANDFKTYIPWGMNELSLLHSHTTRTLTDGPIPGQEKPFALEIVHDRFELNKAVPPRGLLDLRIRMANAFGWWLTHSYWYPNPATESLIFGVT